MFRTLKVVLINVSCFLNMMMLIACVLARYLARRVMNMMIMAIELM